MMILHLNLTISFHFQLKTWMKLKVIGKDKREFIAFILPTAIQEIMKASLPPPTDKNFRDLISSAGGDSTYKSTFLNQPKKISAVRIFRTALSTNILQQIDRCMYLIINCYNINVFINPRSVRMKQVCNIDIHIREVERICCYTIK